MADAVAGARQGQKTPDGYYNIERMLRRVLATRGTVLLCGTCMDARGLRDDEVLEGSRRSTMDELASETHPPARSSSSDPEDARTRNTPLSFAGRRWAWPNRPSRRARDRLGRARSRCGRHTGHGRGADNPDMEAADNRIRTRGTSDHIRMTSRAASDGRHRLPSGGPECHRRDQSQSRRPDKCRLSNAALRHWSAAPVTV